MQRPASRASAKWLHSSYRQLVTAASFLCEHHPNLIKEVEPLSFFKQNRITLFPWQACQSPSLTMSFSTRADTFVTQELDRILDNNRSHPELVNHNLYNLLLDEDLIRLAHKNLISAAGQRKGFYERGALIPAAGHRKGFYERGALVRDIVRGLHDEKFQFESAGNSTKPEEQEDERFSHGTPFRDKIVLEALRIVLERVYGPIFLDTSHGFRKSRSRHTALQSVRRGLQHHNFALVGRIDSQGFDRHVLVKLLEQKIGDKRFIRLIWKALKAGYGDRKNHVWTIKSIWEGHPEANNLSAILTNIYFHALDCWIRDKKQTFDRGMSTGAVDPQLLSLTNRIRYLKHEGKLARVKVLTSRRAQIASRGWNDVSVRRLFYVRYVDEMLLTFIASKEEVLSFRKDLEEFLVQAMKLDISGGGFRLSNLRDSHVFFLGTKISVTKPSMPSQSGLLQLVSGRVRLEAPMDKIIDELAKLRMVSQGGTKPHPVTFLARCSHNEIINYYNWIMRGCCTYYSFVDNFYQLTNYLRLAIRSSCVRTLTMKLKRFRSARTYKDFGTECAARFSVPVRNGCIVDDQLADDEKALLKNRIKAARRLKLEWEDLGEVEKGLLQRFIIPRRIEEANGDVNLEFRGNYLLFCSNGSEHEETKRALRKLELLPPAQNLWDFKETIAPPPRPWLSIDYETIYPY